MCILIGEKEQEKAKIEGKKDGIKGSEKTRHYWALSSTAMPHSRWTNLWDSVDAY